MAATDVKFGITRHAGALIESLSSKAKIEEHVLKGSDGVNARVHVNNPTTSFNVKGHGTLSATLGIGSSEITDVTGGVTTILEIDRDEKNDGWDGWAYSGNNHPSAEEVV